MNIFTNDRSDYPAYPIEQRYALTDFYARLANLLAGEMNLPNTAPITLSDFALSGGADAITITRHFGRFPVNGGSEGAIDLARLVDLGVESSPLLILQIIDHTDAGNTVDDALHWYLEAYRHAQNAVRLYKSDDGLLIEIENELLDLTREQGLFLALSELLHADHTGEIIPLRRSSISQTFRASRAFSQRIKGSGFGSTQGEEIGSRLDATLFRFQRAPVSEVEMALQAHMPELVTDERPWQAASLRLAQVQFDAAFRLIRGNWELLGTELILVSGVQFLSGENPSSQEASIVPWAMLHLNESGDFGITDQDKLLTLLQSQSPTNDAAIDLNRYLQTASERNVKNS